MQSRTASAGLRVGLISNGEIPRTPFSVYSIVLDLLTLHYEKGARLCVYTIVSWVNTRRRVLSPVKQCLCTFYDGSVLGTGLVRGCARHCVSVGRSLC